MLIAQISDPHITARGMPAFDGSDAVAAVERAVAHVNALRPAADAVLATGDLTDEGRPEEYAVLRETLAGLKAPVYLVPGNHDEREAMHAAFADAGYWPEEGAFLHYTVEEHPVRLIGLDTTVLPRAAGGAMCAERLAWLDARLAEEPERPTLIFMHHPPAKTGHALMDSMWCEGGDAMAEVVRRHPQVMRVVCGHMHRAVTLDWAGTTLCVAPSVTAQLELDLDPDRKPAWSRTEPRACLVHHWAPGRGLATHVSLIAP